MVSHQQNFIIPTNLYLTTQCVRRQNSLKNHKMEAETDNRSWKQTSKNL